MTQGHCIFCEAELMTEWVHFDEEGRECASTELRFFSHRIGEMATNENTKQGKTWCPECRLMYEYNHLW